MLYCLTKYDLYFTILLNEECAILLKKRPGTFRNSPSAGELKNEPVKRPACYGAFSSTVRLHRPFVLKILIFRVPAASTGSS